ncbi:MAG: hypothetical protein N3A61_05415 [Ignavibacteria bacterium]|nr:hypothetical protein [Ignavibacteria bacterium]
MSKNFRFTKEDVDKIANALGASVREESNHFRLEIINTERRSSLYLEIYSQIDIGNEKGELIAIYAPLTHLQLHFCTGYVISELLEEVTFIAEEGNRLCGLTVEKAGGCSLYSNVNRSLLSGDFTKLGPEVMLSSIALSLVEDVLNDESKKSENKNHD